MTQLALLLSFCTHPRACQAVSLESKVAPALTEAKKNSAKDKLEATRKPKASGGAGPAAKAKGKPKGKAKGKAKARAAASA